MLDYQCKFTNHYTGEVVFGIIQEFSDEAKKALTEGNYLVECAVTGRPFIVPQKDVTTIPFGKFVGGDELFDDEYHRHVAAEQKKAEQLSDSLPDDGKLHVGSLFTVGVADGCAWYVVTKVNRKTCDIEWRGFCGDRWHDRQFGWGGRFKIDDIKPLTHRFRRSAKLPPLSKLPS